MLGSDANCQRVRRFGNKCVVWRCGALSLLLRVRFRFRTQRGGSCVFRHRALDSDAEVPRFLHFLTITYFYSAVRILFCLAENCSTLPAFQYGERTLLYGDGIGYGTVCRLIFARISMTMDCLGTVYNYNCSRGFHLEGPPMIMCKRIFYLFFSCPK